MKTILVTGGAGFIGSQVVRELEARSYSVVVVDALTYAGNPSNLSGTNARMVVADIRDRDEMRRIMRETQPYGVLHLAADSHVQRSYADQRRFLEVNAIGTDNMLAAASDLLIRRFVHISTDEVFGDVVEGFMDEEGAIKPRNPYSASKAAAEAVVFSYRNWKGFPVSMVRLSNCYGPRQHVEKLIPATISRLFVKQPAIVHGDGQQVRQWLHVTDASRGIVDVMEKGEPGETFNLPGSAEFSVLTTVQLLGAIIGDTAEWRFVHDRPGKADRRYGMSGIKARNLLGWRPQVDLQAGLQSTVAWYLGNQKYMQEAA